MSLEVYDAFLRRYGRLPTEFDRDYLEMLRMSKYRILAVPDLKPGHCANCGSAKNDGRQYIDFKLEVDWYGIVFICGFCLKDIANAMGLFQPFIDEIAKLKAELLGIKIQQQKETSLEERMLLTFKEVKEYLDNLHITSNDLPSDSNPSVVSNSTVADESGSVEAESGIVKQNPSKRSANLRSLTDLLDTPTG